MSEKSSCLRAFIYSFFQGSWNNCFSHIYSCTNAHANQSKRICPRFSKVIINMGQHIRFSYLSYRREAKAQLILRICANSSEPCAVHTITKEERKIYVEFFLYINVPMLTNVQWEAKETKTDIYLWRQTNLEGSPDWSWSLLSIEAQYRLMQ